MGDNGSKLIADTLFGLKFRWLVLLTGVLAVTCGRVSNEADKNPENGLEFLRHPSDKTPSSSVSVEETLQLRGIGLPKGSAYTLLLTFGFPLTGSGSGPIGRCRNLW